MSFVGLGPIEILILIVMGVVVLAVMVFAFSTISRRDAAPGVRCPNCAKSMPPGSKTCPSCGHAIVP